MSVGDFVGALLGDGDGANDGDGDGSAVTGKQHTHVECGAHQHCQSHAVPSGQYVSLNAHTPPMSKHLLSGSGQDGTGDFVGLNVGAGDGDFDGDEEPEKGVTEINCQGKKNEVAADDG